MKLRSARKDDSVVLAALLRELAEQQGTASMLAVKDDGTDAIIAVGNNGCLVPALNKDGFVLHQCVVAEGEIAL